MSDLLEWWNAIYWVPLSISLLWILLTALTGHNTHHGYGHAAAHGHAHGADAGHAHGHVGAHAHHVDGHGHAHDHAHAHAHGHGHHHGEHLQQAVRPWSSRLIDLTGIGRVPITLTIGLFLLFWGTFGLLTNNTMRNSGMSPAAFVGPSLLGTLIFTTFVTRMVIGVVGRLIPPTETFAITAYDLIGRQGTVVYTVSATAGTVQVPDEYGTVHRRMAKVEPGAPSLPANTRILVVGVDDGNDNLDVNDRLIVRAYSDSTEPR